MFRCQWKDSHNRNCYAVTTSIWDWTEVKSHSLYKQVEGRGKYHDSCDDHTRDDWHRLEHTDLPTWERNHLLSRTTSGKRSRMPGLKPNREASDLAQCGATQRKADDAMGRQRGAPQAAVCLGHSSERPPLIRWGVPSLPSSQDQSWKNVWLSTKCLYQKV